MKNTLTKKIFNTALLAALVTVPALSMMSSASADARPSKHSIRKPRAHQPGRRTPRNIHRQRRNNRSRMLTVTGRIVRMGGAGRFNVRSGNRTYNVYPSSHNGRRVRRGDTVRVYGQQRGNDIRNASVAIVRHH